MSNELILYANYYHNLGMNIYPVKDDNYKIPRDNNWRQYISMSQDSQFINSIDWSSAAGIGLVLGYNDYHAIDIDDLYPYLNQERCNISKADFIDECLRVLDLPKDYEWVICSGSGRGIHIIFKCHDSIASSNIYSYSPKKSLKVGQSSLHGIDVFKRMELRWRGFLVLPPSIHASGMTYSFSNGYIPRSAPKNVLVSKLYELLNKFCGDICYVQCIYNGLDLHLVELVKEIEDSSSGSLEVVDDVNMLRECYTADAFNALGVCYALGKNVEVDLAKAQYYFYLSGNEMSHFNLASLMACGVVQGDENLINYHLSKCQSMAKDKIALVIENSKLPKSPTEDMSKALSINTNSETLCYRRIDMRRFDQKEIDLVSDAIVVSASYGLVVAFYMKNGGKTFIPLDVNSSLTIGESVDLSRCFIEIFEKNGIREHRICVEEG